MKHYKILMIILSSILYHSIDASPSLGRGDIAFISFSITPGSTNQGFFTMMSRKSIPAGTQIVVTNYYLMSTSGTSSTFSQTYGTGPQMQTAKGQLSITFNEPISAGQTFQINFNGTSLTSTVGTGIGSGNLDFGNDDESGVVWVYEKYLNGSNWENFVVTGIAYDIDWLDDHPGRTALTSGTNYTIFSVSGANTKCGAWQPYSNGNSTYKSGISATSNTFFNTNDWIFGTSTSTWNTCDITEVNNRLVTYVSNNLVFADRYRITPSGTWETYDASSSSWVSTTVNWATSNPTLSTAEVTIQKNTTLSSANPTFSCGKLIVGDPSTSSKVTLTVDPGVNLVINYGIDFHQSSTGEIPIIHMKSGMVGSSMQYATLAPTSAVLSDPDGLFKYDYVINYPGWHHLISPISSTFTDIVATSPNNNFQFTSGNPGTGNFFFWDPSISQWVNGALTDNFSSKPYTIYVDEDEYPVTLSIQGSLNTYSINQNTSYNQSTQYHNPTSNGNVPWWGGGVDDGWNMYGNPYLSYLSTDTLLEYFSKSDGKLADNKMTGLNNQIYVWQPDLGQNSPTGTGTKFNDISHYRNRTIASSNPSGDNQAKFLPPFQAFFMQSDNTNGNGHAVSKKYRFGSSATITNSNSIINKSINASKGNHTLFLFSDSLKIKASTYVSHSSIRSLQYFEEADIILNKEHNCVFGSYFDSTLFKIKYWPTSQDTAAINIYLEYPQPNIEFTLMPESESGYLLDRKLNILHNFELSPYSFVHDTTWNNQLRFKWYLNKNSHLETSELLVKNLALQIRYSSNGEILISCPNSKELKFFNSTGQLVLTVYPIGGNYTIHRGILSSGIYHCTDELESVKFVINE